MHFNSVKILFPLFPFTALALPFIGTGQVNYVPNPGFEIISDCDLEFGEVDKALPWMNLGTPMGSADLFHACSTNGFYDLPTTGCAENYPNSGDAMIGMGHLLLKEGIYVRLTDELPLDIDIYVAFSVLPLKKCGVPMETLCYSNTQCLAFSDVTLQSEIAVLKPDEIIDNWSNWTQLQTCYRANGTEKMVLIGDFQLFSETLIDCDFINPAANVSYSYVDDIIVSPFDVVPDTFYLCEGEILDLDATFYEVAISWSDGVNGAIRTIDQAGSYIVRGLVDNCFLTDSTLVIEIPARTEEIELDICAGEVITLESPFAGSWENGDTNRVRTITRPGIYKSAVLTPCGERSREYTVTTTDCEIRYFVPNAFSPNNDGINDHLQFFFDADFDFTGELNVFDRWGNQLFHAKDVGPLSPITWDGSFKNKDLGAGIVVWTYEYISVRDRQTRTIAGDVMIVK